jgi:LysR family glycine cleavage system transcriptional activator
MTKLPPLNSLRYFLVAAQTLSFKQAAAQLFVTQAAISQHIKTLETHLGRPLFIRGTRQVTLTADGIQLLPDIQLAFEALARGVGRFQNDPQSNILNVSVLQSFAFRWLVPRLSSFQKAHPEIGVRLDPGNTLITFENDDMDIAIRYGQGQYPGLESRLLLEDKMCLVCHPSLLKDELTLDTLKLLPMLEENSSDIRSAWQHFFEVNGIKEERYRRALQVEDSSSMIVEAALAGQGMAMLRYSLIYQQLERGQLVQLFDYEQKCDYAYYIVAPGHYFKRHKIACFEAWLRAEMLDMKLQKTKV